MFTAYAVTTKDFLRLQSNDLEPGAIFTKHS